MDWRVIEWRPYSTFAVLIFVFAAPILVAEYRVANDRFLRCAREYQRVVLTLALGLGVVLAARYLVVARPLIGSVDFFYYASTARDDLHGVVESSFAKYGYFPGGYRFWEAVMGLFGEALSTLQWTIVGVLTINAMLVATIVARLLRNVGWGILAALLYLAFASRFEGLSGTTEPIATLFALTGVLLWGGMPLRGAAGWRRTFLLGLGLGLAVWVKQQAGLVAVGAAVLVVTNLTVDREKRHSIEQMTAIPVAAAVVFLVAILLEGQGLLPLRTGLSAVGEYEATGSHISNVFVVFQHMGVAHWAVLLALLMWGGTLAIPRLRRMHCEPTTAIIGFALLASLTTLVQFSKRPYLHYALLAAPFLAIAIVAAGVQVSRAVAAAKPRTAPIVGVLTAGAISFVIVASSPSDKSFRIWPPSWTPEVAHENPWHEQMDVASDLRVLKALIKPGDDVLILPPRRNVIHFLLGSRSISGNGYGWGPREASKILMSRTLDAVLVLNRQVLDDTDIETCELMHCDRAVSTFEKNGFAKVAELKAMTLWRRVR